MKKNASAAAPVVELETTATSVTTTHEDYDEMPYESHTYPFSSPVNLYTLAKLFKINAADFKTAKVLELGCASGGNIIPYAMAYPKAQFTGIDLSQRHVEDGKKQIEALGLKNITLQHLSISDVKKDFGKFDYIIVHGVYSWVPADVQDKILEICNNHLTDNGVAYISYNTLPGWNMVQTVRDMMIYHTERFSSLTEKAQQARLLLNFVKESFGKDGNTPYVRLIEEESKVLAGQGDYYLIHDHLNRDNNPCYFHEFIARAAKHNLGYISDIDISQMYLASMPANVQTVLATIQNDVVRTEQYIDFISNRRFRMSLLCKNTVQANRSLQPQDIKDFYFRTKIEKKQDDVYTLSALKTITIDVRGNPVAEALCDVLVEKSGQAVAVDKFLQAVHKKLGIKTQSKTENNSVIYKNLMEIILRGGAFLTSDKDQFVTEISERPEVSPLARHQVSTQTWVTNARYEKVNTDLFCRVTMKYLDGTRSIDEVKTEMLKHVQKGELNINRDNKKIDDPKEQEILVGDMLKVALQSLLRSALLIA